ncbi:MAG: glycosyltransferase family 4 protein [Desulfobulbaceae bacterium]|nr:glycosyltransferase family 4 protein [Desulfobulbaceae bacterium]
MVVDDFVSFYKVNPADISLIYNGIDLNKFKPAIRNDLRGDLRKELHIGDDQVLFLFLSYTLRKKGIYPLIEAAAILDKRRRGRFKIVVVGKEPKRSIREKVYEHGLAETVLFHGPTKNPLLYFANSDVFVLPTYYDTCSLVTIEAMACGVPVITSECNGAAGIIDSGVDGHVIRHPPDPASLAQVMEVYFSGAKLLEMSDRAAEKAQAYSLAANHEAVIKVCEEAALAKKHR